MIGGRAIVFKDPAGGMTFGTDIVDGMNIVYPLAHPIDAKFNNTSSVAKSQWSGYVGG